MAEVKSYRDSQEGISVRGAGTICVQLDTFSTTIAAAEVVGNLSAWQTNFATTPTAPMS